MIRRPPRSTQSRSSAASDVYKRQRHERILRESLRVRLRCRCRRQTRAAQVAENSDDRLPLFCRVEEDVATLSAEIPPFQDRDASICHSGKLLLHGSLGGSVVNQRHDALPVLLPVSYTHL